MTIYPAIDIINGECVRLVKGDYSQKTTYDKSPVDVAKKWADMGAEFIHVVDLDGAKSGDMPQEVFKFTLRERAHCDILKV